MNGNKVQFEMLIGQIRVIYMSAPEKKKMYAHYNVVLTYKKRKNKSSII